jgi:hypothetical protein
MVVSVSETFTHSNTCTPKQDYKEQELEKIILKMMKKNGISPKKITKTIDGKLELCDTTNLKLHSLILQAEELGLELKLTKQTLIEIK